MSEVPGDSGDVPGDSGDVPGSSTAPKKPRLRYDCAVRGCTPSTFEVHSYHKVPNKDNRGRVDPRRALWIEACWLTDADLRRRIVICSKHFKARYKMCCF